MERKIIVRARINEETLKRIRFVKREPRRAWGEHRVSDYFGSLIERFTETIEFKILEKDAQIQSLKGELGARDFNVKLRTTEIEKENIKIESLKRQLLELTAKFSKGSNK